MSEIIHAIVWFCNWKQENKTKHPKEKNIFWNTESNMWTGILKAWKDRSLSPHPGLSERPGLSEHPGALLCDSLSVCLSSCPPEPLGLGDMTVGGLLPSMEYGSWHLSSQAHDEVCEDTAVGSCVPGPFPLLSLPPVQHIHCPETQSYSPKGPISLPPVSAFKSFLSRTGVCCLTFLVNKCLQDLLECLWSSPRFPLLLMSFIWLSGLACKQMRRSITSFHPIEMMRRSLGLGGTGLHSLPTWSVRT